MPEIIIEDGTVIADANSYVEEPEAGAYFSGHPDEAVWTGSSTDRHVWALIRAARYLESKFSGRWRGAAVEYDQSLSWPRRVFYGEYLWGAGVEPWVIPQALKDAQCELALRDIKLGESGGILPDLTKTAFASTESLGPISVTYESGAPKLPRFPEIETILAPLLEGAPGTRPVIRG